MSAYALAMSLGVSKEEGKKLHAGYLKGFPGVASWIDASREKFKRDGFIRNEVGRIRHLDKGKAVYDVFGESIMDWKMRKDLERDYGKPQVLQWYRDYKNALNNCLNYQLQSLAASVVNRAALVINKKFKELGINGVVVAQIHDQLVMRVPADKAEECLPWIQDLMENTTKMKGVTLKAPPEVATNLADGH